jgi:hypothetical protein
MTIVGGGLDTFWIGEDELPSDVTPMFAIRAVGTEDEMERLHRLQVKLIQPDLTKPSVDVLEVTFGAHVNPLKRPGWEAGALIPLIVRWTVEEFGAYTLEFHLDGELGESIPISVRPREELQPAPE